MSTKKVLVVTGGITEFWYYIEHRVASGGMASFHATRNCIEIDNVAYQYAGSMEQALGEEYHDVVLYGTYFERKDLSLAAISLWTGCRI